MMISTLIYLLIFIRFSSALNNGLGLRPQMGWNSWYNVHHNITEIVVRQTADAMVATGLAAAGYEYVNMDDCWQVSRDANGTIQPDPEAFPNGIRALADYVHSKKLKFGLYSSRGNMTCAGRPGSEGYERKDANTYAGWNVDYLKLDTCGSINASAIIQYTLMRDALNATGRPIFYSLCGGVGPNDTWPPTTGNSWRTTTDIQAYWAAVIANIDYNDDYAQEAGQGNWNDPDMLQVGRGLMTTAEEMAHFSLWAIAKSPLIIGCDVRNINATSLSILTNREVIAVNQDSLGIQGKKVAFAPAKSPNTSGEVIVADCSSPSIDSTRRQWIYNSEDGSIRSVFNGRCLSIDQCRTGRIDFVILDDCRIDDPKALCHGKNQQWTNNITAQTIVSQMDGSCFDVYNSIGPNVDTYPCNRRVNQNWIWNETDRTIRSKPTGKCLTVPLELEIWAGPLKGGSQAVVLLNRGVTDNEQITVKWTDIGFPADHPALVRDLWAHQDLGIFTDHFTSSNIASHGAMMLNITLTKSIERP